MAISDVSIFNHLEPLAKLSKERKRELADICFIEKVSQNIDPLRMNLSQLSQAIYLLKGELGLYFSDNGKIKLRGGSPAAKHPVNSDANIKETVALTEVEILRIDTDLLDIMMTWDQLSSGDKSTLDKADKSKARTTSQWMQDTSVFSVEKLQNGVFKHLPAARIEEMFKRMSRIQVQAGQVLIEQGDEGDYYYLIESGTAEVSKYMEAQANTQVVAVLQAGSAFGEEALASDNKRNATVTMKTDGELLRLNKQDFVELLKAPLLTQINRSEADQKVASGAIWVDVRLPSEYAFEHIEGAINLPLAEIRTLCENLDRSKTYVLYCSTGRRSAAAAFILAQKGFSVVVLQ